MGTDGWFSDGDTAMGAVVTWWGQLLTGVLSPWPRFTLVQKHTVEFNQVAMANSEGSEAMLNRVMTKDNIGVAVVLEVHKELFGASEYGCGVLTDAQLHGQA